MTSVSPKPVIPLAPASADWVPCLMISINETS
jgi:hypothetical protein